MKSKLLIAIVLAFVAWLSGVWMGYWYGRDKELYECSKQFHVIPATMTYDDWLKRR